MSSGGTIGRQLDQIPGYAGYRDRERRRDSDRAIRDNLALEYGQLADRLGRVARSLAEQRDIAAIPVVDRPHKRLVSFIDRLRTATYGYAPLFSEASVDQDALDQLAAFDRALADQQDALAEQVARLDAAEPGGAEFEQAANEVVRIVEGLHERFDRRDEVILSAKALPRQDVLALLEPAQPRSAPVAFRLHEGEAVARDGVNYSVVGRVSVESEQVAWRAFQLRGGAGDAWLLVGSDPAGPMFWTRRIEPPGDVDQLSVSVSGATYNRESVLTGAGEIIGASGSASDQPARLARFTATAGADALHLFEWPSGTLALLGGPVDPRSVELFTREG